MSFHVGIVSYSSYFAVYNEKTKETIVFKITNRLKKDSKDEDVKEMLKEITAKVNGKLGFACIYLDAYYGNEIRKSFIKNGKSFGFLNIQIINWGAAFYLNFISQINRKPINGDKIWLLGNARCFILEITNSKAKMIKRIYIPQQKDLKKILEEVKNKISGDPLCPDILIYGKDNRLELDQLKTLFPKCEYFEVNSHWSIENACLIKTRIMAKDAELFQFDVEMQTYARTDFKINENIIFSIDKLKVLPLEKILTVTANEGYVFKIFYDEKYPDEITIPSPKKNTEQFEIIVKIDLNRIITIDYFESINEVVNLTQKPNPFLKSYKIPQKVRTGEDRSVVGIDLGTSRCFAAVNRRNGIEIIALDNTGERHLPSYVSFIENSELCGQIVVNKLKQNSKFTIFDAKRVIGKKFNEIKIDETWPFEVISDKESIILKVHGYEGIVFMVPEQISAILLKHIKKKCEEIHGKELNEVIITVPAAFSENQKCATIKAGKLAGWDFVDLLPEPIAASMAYFVDRPIPDEFIFLIFDFGGGTLDVCIVKVINENLDILNIGGDANLGGRDFDNLLFNHFSSILKDKYNVDVKSKDRSKYILLQKCMEIKHSLSFQKGDTLDICDFNTQLDDTIAITTQDFETMSSKLLIKIQNVIIDTLSTTEFTSKDIHKVLLVGGSSRMPMIRELLRKMFSKAEHCCEENPDEVVAIGAAYYANHLASTL